MVKAKGGYDVILRDMRKNSMEMMLEMAPINAVTGTKDEDGTFSRDEEANNDASFLLSHADYFDYDILYGEDTSIGDINEYGHYAGEKAQKPFEAEEKELEVISSTASTKEAPKPAEDKKEVTRCLAKLISETLVLS